jgi:hypothetical protein
LLLSASFTAFSKSCNNLLIRAILLSKLGSGKQAKAITNETLEAAAKIPTTKEGTISLPA